MDCSRRAGIGQWHEYDHVACNKLDIFHRPCLFFSFRQSPSQRKIYNPSTFIKTRPLTSSRDANITHVRVSAFPVLLPQTKNPQQEASLVCDGHSHNADAVR